MLIALLARLFKWNPMPPSADPVQPDPLPIPPIELPKEPTLADKLYNTSKSCIGIDITPGDAIPDPVACVAQLQEVHRRALGQYIGSGAALYSTYALLTELKESDLFMDVSDPLPGDIWLYATGTGNGTVSNGHCGVVGKTNWMSNTSFGPDRGKWMANYTKETVRAYFETKGGYPPHYFRPI